MLRSFRTFRTYTLHQTSLLVASLVPCMHFHTKRTEYIGFLFYLDETSKSVDADDKFRLLAFAAIDATFASQTHAAINAISVCNVTAQAVVHPENFAGSHALLFDCRLQGLQLLQMHGVRHGIE